MSSSTFNLEFAPLVMVLAKIDLASISELNATSDIVVQAMVELGLPISSEVSEGVFLSLIHI